MFKLEQEVLIFNFVAPQPISTRSFSVAIFEDYNIAMGNCRYNCKNLDTNIKIEQVDGAPSHIPAPVPSCISLHIKIPNAFL